jgi:hypothetical protein
MYDSGKVIAFLIILVGLVTFPIWYGLASGAADVRPEPKKEAGKCVESADYMRAWHMDILNEWRDEAVREARRTYTSARGVKFEKSLTNTCMDCHKDEEKFCGECHDYVGVDPYCWNCHNLPGKE